MTAADVGASLEVTRRGGSGGVPAPVWRAGVPSADPQFEQNRAPGVVSVPHEPHRDMSPAPHCGQNFAPAGAGELHDGQAVVMRSAAADAAGRARERAANGDAARVR